MILYDEERNLKKKFFFDVTFFRFIRYLYENNYETGRI